MSVNEFSKNWYVRFGFFYLLYSGGALIALTLAYLLRFDFDVPLKEWNVFWLVAFWIVPLKLVCLYLFRQFHVIPGYFGMTGLAQITYAMMVSTALISVVRLNLGLPYAPPRGVILIDFLLSIVILGGLRVMLRLQREHRWSKQRSQLYRPQKVAIIGAGDAGITLARELKVKRGLGLAPIAFFDDDTSKWKLRVHDVIVMGPPELLLKHRGRRLGIELAIIAMPSAPPKRIKEIVSILNRCHIRFETVPSLDQLATGKVTVSQIRPVEIEDLLGRDSVELQTGQIRALLRGRRVMVTGAGGSIGSELCRQIALYSPEKLILVERSEVQLFPVQQELIELGYREWITPWVADILDEARMRWIYRQSAPEIVFHAAAHKHVPLMEHQPDEAIRNNLLGTAQLAELSIEFEVERFVLISTDKAINPVNVMGATKRMAEIFLQSFHAEHPRGTKFMAVRFGNVLGSSGSVIPIFKRQIAAGGPVTVTHPDVARYFMTIPEAVGLVLQSGTQGQGGEIFVLDMGKPVKIVDLARQLIELSGFRPGEDIEIEFTGLRDGEKLFEELSYHGERYAPTGHPKIMRFTAQPPRLSQVQTWIEQLKSELNQGTDVNRLKSLLKHAVPEYEPYVKATGVASGNEDRAEATCGHKSEGRAPRVPI